MRNSSERSCITTSTNSATCGWTMNDAMRACRRLRVDDPVGPGLRELGDAVVLAGAGDDEQPIVERPPRQRDEQVLGVTERAATSVAARRCRPRGGVSSTVASATTVGTGDAGDPLAVDVDHDDVAARALHVVGDGPPDTTPAAHDDVPVHVSDPSIHPAPPDVLTQLTLHDELHAAVNVYSTVPTPHDDHDDRERLLRGAERFDTPETDHRDRRVQRVGRPIPRKT